MTRKSLSLLTKSAFLICCFVLTLASFAQYYFIDVLENPNATDHQNIRNFIKTGFEGLIFEKETLTEKQ